MTFVFSSESVSEGHPDKVCDQISDAILDAALAQDPNSRVAAETFATTGLILAGGEITTKTKLDVPAIVRQTLLDIGYTDPSWGIDAASCCILNTIHAQSPDIAQGVNKGEGLYKDMGAGDQGMMFGYACRQTPVLMPLPIYLAHGLVKELARIRKAKELTYLRPDAKAQVSVDFVSGVPKRVHTVVISTQHEPDAALNTITHDMIEHVIKRVIPSNLLDNNTRYYINPTGRFVIGGPNGDTGLTGRKIIVDSYGGWGAHGGGAFSGKDPSKVDRTGAYMARYIAKNLVAAGVADEIEVQLAYAIGVAEPVSVLARSKGTSRVSNEAIVDLVRKHFDLTPEGMITTLNLKRPIYKKTAAYGHFGREEETSFTWEKTDKVDLLKKDLR